MSHALDITAYTTVGVIMGSQSDWPTMQHCCTVLKNLSIPYQANIISAHRTPQRLYQYAQQAAEQGLQVIIAGAGGAAHLPGMVAAMTPLPVLGVPMKTSDLSGMDSLYSIVQMPYGVPVACLKIGEAGAKNAALLAARILALHDEALRKRLHAFHQQQTQQVDDKPC